MSYYVLPDYWIAGYAEGDAVELSATILPTLTAVASINGVSNVSSLISPSLSFNSEANRVTSFDPDTVSAFASLSSEAFLTRNVSSSIPVSVSVNVVPAATFAGASSIGVISYVDAGLITVLSARANIENSCIVTADSRFYWVDETIADETWTGQPDTNEIWTVQSDTLENWTRV